ncbi:MAG: M12 family metallo-peptidase, partial [Bacteroidia bacterium]|nr:M12 family metallo-peptidase [Bacteroidia bacterium]
MTIRRFAAPTACCAIALSLTTHALASGGSAVPPVQDCGLERIAHFIPCEPLLPRDLPATFSVEAPLGANMVTLDLTKHSVRGDRFKVLVDDGRSLREVDAPAIRTYRGSIAGRPNTSVVGSLLPSGFSGIVTLEDGSTFGIQPLHELCADLPESTVHATYAASDVAVDEAGCALGRPGFDTELYRVAPESGGGGSLAGVTPQQVEIACETDYEFFQKNGSSVANTVNDIENIIANVNTIYDRDVNIVHEISVMVIRSASADPYAGTTIDARLDEFDAAWGVAPLSGVFRDIAHMFSGYNYSGGTIGLAYLGVICQPASGVGYGVVESRYTTSLTFRVSLSAHELGHNWNCTHCDADGNDNCHIMCSANGACGGISGSNLKLDSRAISESTAFSAAVACDFTRPAALTVPFIDDFDATASISTQRWTYNDGVLVTSGAAGEPTAPSS